MVQRSIAAHIGSHDLCIVATAGKGVARAGFYPTTTSTYLSNSWGIVLAKVYGPLNEAAVIAVLLS
ncbi:MAG: hypothetical protein EBY69_03950, partial [Burkholderiaceae bacterium]|nr:hypothetical protein [Burkholderiaceae bacterium]